jgi:hypothetical protein
MSTSWPATWSAFAFKERAESTFNPSGTRICLLGVFHPADEFISTQWSEALPGQTDAGILCCGQGGAEVFGDDGVNHTSFQILEEGGGGRSGLRRH